MRQIKFRAWDKATNTMLLPEAENQKEASWKYYLNGGVSIMGTWATPDVELMQFTGLKDKNGTEIYIGDILRGTIGAGAGMQSKPDKPCIYEIRQGDDSFLFYQQRITKFYGDYRGYRRPEKMEIIGNIYENTELLK